MKSHKSKFLNLKSNSAGFTLIELILYVSLVSIFLTGAILFSWDVIYGREKAVKQQIVQQSGRAAMARIGYEITRAVDIVSVSTNQIVLSNGATNTTIGLVSGRIQITTGGAGPFNLTSNQATVSALTFTNRTSTDNNTHNINVSMTLTQSSAGGKIEFAATTTINDTFELKGEFNEARRLVVDSQPSVAPTTTIAGVSVTNPETTTVTIDKLNVAWSGVAAARRITNVNINGGTAEWTGTGTTGTTLELTNFAVTNALGTIPVVFTFNGTMAGGVFTYSYVMSDGSLAKGQVDMVLYTFGSCGGGCSHYGYSGAICRGSASECTSAGETNVSTLNSVCSTSGAADTCCCKP